MAGPNTTTVLVNNTAPGIPWNINASGQFAGLLLGTGGMSKGLVFSNFNFSIPSGAIIVGVEAATTYSVLGPQSIIKDTICKLMVNTFEVGTNQASNLYPQTFASPVIYGSSSNLWGTTLTTSDINSPNFGFVVYISSKPTTNSFGAFNYSSAYSYMKVYYTNSTGIIQSQTSISNSAFCANKILYFSNTNKEIYKVEIFSLEGKKIKEFFKDDSQADLTDLDDGVYIYTLTLKSGNMFRGKFNLN